MKKIMCLLCLAFTGLAVLSVAPSVAVLDFSSGNYCGEQEASFMTAMFRGELVRTGRAEVVDRGNMDKIIDEFDYKVKALAGEFAQKFPVENRFIGLWEVLVGRIRV